jgi:hypothetical protein
MPVNTEAPKDDLTREITLIKSHGHLEDVLCALTGLCTIIADFPAGFGKIFGKLREPSSSINKIGDHIRQSSAASAGTLNELTGLLREIADAFIDIM